MTDKIEVTQADRDAAWHYADFGHLHTRQERERWFAGYYDNCSVGYPIHAFARHAHAARIEGARAAIEAAAKCCDANLAYDDCCFDSLGDAEQAIHNLDPEQIVKGTKPMTAIDYYEMCGELLAIADRMDCNQYSGDVWTIRNMIADLRALSVEQIMKGRGE